MGRRQSVRLPPPDDLNEFADAIRRHREQLLKDWANEVKGLPAARGLDKPTLRDHIPPLLDELATALAQGHTESILTLHLADSPQVHGAQRLRAGFDIVEVVAEYNILRELLYSAAQREGIGMSSDISRILNRIVDGAIALAVDTYAKERAIEIQQRREEHLAFVMHDLRTPLAAMQTAGLILEETLPATVKTQRVQNMLRLLRRNAERVHALLQVAAQEHHNMAATIIDRVKVEPREFDLWPLVESLIHDLRPLSEPMPVQIVNAVPSDLVVNADAELLNQVFQNLLSNAIKFTSTGQIVIGAEYKNGDVECWVMDTGPGIPLELHEKIFDKFVTGEENGDQGLGLAIVKQIIDGHGGTVAVESTVGKGSTFRFILPGKPKE
jgi:two-component system, OmpR family, phosphate regulon sensor histidine kinase PhoR